MMDINMNNTHVVVTSVVILKEIKELFKLFESKNTLVIYFSSHNFNKKKKG